MDGSDFYTPSDVPESIRAFDSEVRQLAVGKAGKNGSLRLVFQSDQNGRTVVGDLFSEAPLHVQRALHYDDSCPDLAYLYMVSSSGGVLQGDRYRIDITMKKNSRAHVTTQGATRIYGMDSNSATQMINITLDEDSYLEFVPDQIIPYRNSRFYQKTSLRVHDSATAVCSEIVTPGRTAMNESFEYDVCYLKTSASNHENVTRFTDAASLEPKKQGLSSPGILGGHAVVGSVYILTGRQNASGLHGQVNAAISESAGVLGGASLMRNDAGLLVRILGDETEPVRDAILGIVGSVRRAAIGASFSGIRKN